MSSAFFDHFQTHPPTTSAMPQFFEIPPTHPTSAFALKIFDVFDILKWKHNNEDANYVII